MQKIIYIFFIFFIQFACTAKDSYFLMLKNNKVNVRYGPSFDYPIKYTYKKKFLPVLVIDTKENFRRIQDHKNNAGWIHISQLKKTSSLILLEDKIMFKKGSKFSTPIAKIKKGRLLLVKKCSNQWCLVSTGNFSGWVEDNKVWGSTQ